MKKTIMFLFILINISCNSIINKLSNIESVKYEYKDSYVNLRLTLFKNNTFYYTTSGDVSNSQSSGNWELIDGKLILNSLRLQKSR